MKLDAGRGNKLHYYVPRYMKNQSPNASTLICQRLTSEAFCRQIITDKVRTSMDLSAIMNRREIRHPGTFGETQNLTIRVSQ